MDKDDDGPTVGLVLGGDGDVDERVHVGRQAKEGERDQRPESRGGRARDGEACDGGCDGGGAERAVQRDDHVAHRLLDVRAVPKLDGGANKVLEEGLGEPWKAGPARRGEARRCVARGGHAREHPHHLAVAGGGQLDDVKVVRLVLLEVVAFGREVEGPVGVAVWARVAGTCAPPCARVQRCSVAVLSVRVQRSACVCSVQRAAWPRCGRRCGTKEAAQTNFSAW